MNFNLKLKKIRTFRKMTQKELSEKIGGTSRFIRVRIVLRNGFLGVSCTNSYSGTLNTDSSGRLRTTKEDPTAHGFGLDQMTAVAEKYHSILDISYTDTEFTVQTALKLPEQP